MQIAVAPNYEATLFVALCDRLPVSVLMHLVEHYFVGTRIAFVPADGAVVTIVQRTGNLVLRNHAAPVVAMAWSPDGCHLATLALDNKLVITNTTTGQPEHTIPYHTDPHACWRRCIRWASATVVHLLMSPEGCDVIDVTTSIRSYIPIEQHYRGVISLSTDGSALFMEHHLPTHAAGVLDLETNTVMPLPALADLAFAEWSPTDSFLAIAFQRDGRVVIMDPLVGDILNEFTIPITEPLAQGRWSPSERYLAVVTTRRQELLVWDALAGTPVGRPISVPAGISSFEWGSREDTLIVCVEDDVYEYYPFIRDGRLPFPHETRQSGEPWQNHPELDPRQSGL